MQLSRRVLRRRAVPTLALSIVSLVVVTTFVLPAASDTLTVETFQGTAVADPTAWVAGGTGSSITGWPGEACLTAGTNTAQTPIAGCGLGSPDASGSGALRITPADLSKAGFALFNQPQPATAGLDISFHQAQWGGSGADGTSFFLVDGTTNLTQPGLPGGALGYSSDGVGDGVDNGLIGIGLDAFGNFSNPLSAGTGCAAGTGPGSNGPGQTANTVAIRGPGNGTAGYCFLGTSGDLTAHAITLHGATRAATDLLVRIVIDPSSAATHNVTVFLNGTQVCRSRHHRRCSMPRPTSSGLQRQLARSPTTTKCGDSRSKRLCRSYR